MTWNDLARKYFPRISNTSAGILLWEGTAFPMASAKIVERQLADHKRYGCKTWQEAVARMQRLVDKAMKQKERT